MDVHLIIDAPVDVVWARLVEVESWPSWTRSMTEVTKADDGPLHTAATVWIRQPKLGRRPWTIGAYDEGRRFDWSTKLPGMTVTAAHTVETVTNDSTRLSFVVRTSGPLATVLTPLLRPMMRTSIGQEMAGIKGAAEARL